MGELGQPLRQCYVAIDEFQTLAGENLRLLLEQARSFGISLILANQTIADLTTHSSETEPEEIRSEFFNVFSLSHLALWKIAAANDDKRGADVGGRSLIVSRVGGHNQSKPNGIDYNLPYQTSILTRASTDEALLIATRQLASENPIGQRHSKNRTRRARKQPGWDDWIRYGVSLVGP